MGLYVCPLQDLRRHWLRQGVEFWQQASRTAKRMIPLPEDGGLTSGDLRLAIELHSASAARWRKEKRMKRIWIGLIALLAMAGGYRIVDLKPQESQELSQLQAKVDAAQKNLDTALDALKKKRSAVCFAHGLSKDACQ